MACCIIAAYLAALFMAKLRRWAVFLGFVRVGEHDDPDTLWRRIGRRIRPRHRSSATGR